MNEEKDNHWIDFQPPDWKNKWEWVFHPICIILMFFFFYFIWEWRFGHGLGISKTHHQSMDHGGPNGHGKIIAITLNKRNNMYHEEKIINGVLHFRSHPDHEFVPYSAERLTALIFERREEVIQNTRKNVTEEIHREIAEKFGLTTLL